MLKRWSDAGTAYIIVLVKSNTMHRRVICSSAERQNGRAVNMTGAEIGIILLVSALYADSRRDKKERA